MSEIIRVDLDSLISSGEKIIVELGCGDKKKQGSIGIDKVDLPNVDIVADLEKGLSFFPDNSVSEIHSRSVFEHVESFDNLMREIVRVLTRDGKTYVFVPHFSNPHYYSDYTHNRFFGLYTFYYFVNLEHQLKRKVPNFYTDIRIKIISQRLIFRSSFKVMNPIKKLFGWFVNLHTLLQEYYEENLCYMVPCHGIEIIFVPNK